MREWVSVEERTPDAEEEVRLCCETSNGHRYQCRGSMSRPEHTGMTRASAGIGSAAKNMTRSGMIIW